MSPPVKILHNSPTLEDLDLGRALFSPVKEENSGKEVEDVSVTAEEGLGDLEKGTQNKKPHHPLFPPDQEIDLHKILGSLDEKEQRGFLIAALEHFAKQKDEPKVQEVTGLLELSLPLFDMPDSERLQVYTLMYLSLKGSKLPQEEYVKNIGEGLAEGLVDSKASLATQVKQMILAREFFDLTENLDQLAAFSKTLSNTQEEISKTLNGNSRLMGDERIELARLAVRLDQILLGERLIEVGHEDYEGPTIGAQILPRLKTLGKELESASGRSLEKKLSDGIFLAQALARLRDLTHGKPPQIDSSELEKEFQALTQMMGKLFSEAMAQDPGAPEIQKDLAEKIVQDLKDRFAQALKNGDEGWLGQLNPKTILDFARKSQEAHLLASKIQDLKSGQSLENIFKAANIFAGLDLKARVRETLKPIEELQVELEPKEARGLLLLKLGQVYQRAQLGSEANQAWERIISLSNSEENPVLKSLAGQAHFNSLLSRGKLVEARDFLKGLPETPEIKNLLEKMEMGLKTQRLLGGIQILSGALSDYLSHCCEEEPAKKVALEQSIQSVLAETLRLISSGEAKNIESAFKRALKASPFSTEMGNFACESEEGSKLWGLLNSFTDPKVSDGEILQRSLILASTYSVRNYFQGVMQISQFVLHHSQASEEQKVAAKALEEDIPTAAVMTRAFFAAQELISMLSVAGNMLNPNIKMDQGYFLRAGLTIGTLGIARGVGVGAQALWVSRMESVIASPVAFRLSTIGVRSVSEAAAFPLAGMSFESLITGCTANWTFKNFGTQFGSMLVMFSFLNAHGMGLQWAGAKSQQAVQKAKQALEKAKEAGRGLAQAEKNLARAKLADSVVRHGATAWGNRITAFTESGYANEGIGLNHEEKGAAVLARVLHSVVVDAEMHVGGKLVDAASGGRLGKMERATQKTLQNHFLKHQIFKGGNFQGPLADFIRDLIDQGEIAVTDTGLVFNIKGKRGEGKSGTKKKTEPDAEAEPKMPTEAEILEEWRAVLTELIEGGEVHKALHMIRTLEKGKDFINVSETQRQEIKKIFGDLLRKHGLIPSDEQISEQLREVENLLGEILETKGVFVSRGRERLGLVSLENSALTAIEGLDVLLGHLPSRYEKWQVQARILPDGKSVALEQKLPADLESVEGIRGRWMVKPILLTADQAFQLDLVLRNPKGKLELLEPPPDLLVYRPVPSTDQGPEGGGPTGDPFSWSGFFGGAAGSRRFAPWLNKPFLGFNRTKTGDSENKSNMNFPSLAGLELLLSKESTGREIDFSLLNYRNLSPMDFAKGIPVLEYGLYLGFGALLLTIGFTAVQMTRADYLRWRVSRALNPDFEEAGEIIRTLQAVKNPHNPFISSEEQVGFLRELSRRPELRYPEDYRSLVDVPQFLFWGESEMGPTRASTGRDDYLPWKATSHNRKISYLRHVVEHNPNLSFDQKIELLNFARTLPAYFGEIEFGFKRWVEKMDEVAGQVPEGTEVGEVKKNSRKGPSKGNGNGNSAMSVASVLGLEAFLGRDFSGDPIRLFNDFFENHPVLGVGLIFFAGIAAWSMVHAAVQLTRANNLRSRVSKILKPDFADPGEINKVIESVKNSRSMYISPREQIYFLEQISHKSNLRWEHYLALMDIPEKIFDDVVFYNYGVTVVTSFPGHSFWARREKIAYLRTAIENNPHLTEEQKPELFEIAFEKPDAFARRLKRLGDMADLEKDLGTEEKDSEINRDPPEDDPSGKRFRKGP